LSRIDRRIVYLDRLRTLFLAHWRAFAASCCERLLPNYLAFNVLEQWGEPAVLTGTLDEIWASLETNEISDSRAVQMIRQCGDQAPDADEFRSAFSVLAIDAVQALIEALQLYVEARPSTLITISETAIGTIDQYLGVVGDPRPGESSSVSDELIRWISNSPLLLAEIQKQNDDIAALSSHPNLDRGFIERLRHTSNQTGVQPFLRGLTI
jgi:uncharacterized protein